MNAIHNTPVAEETLKELAKEHKKEVRAAAAALPEECDEPAEDIAVEEEASEDDDLDSTTAEAAE